MSRVLSALAQARNGMRMDRLEQPKTLVERTYETLRDAICSGELRPGSHLNQDEIAARLNVSRQPVNSAIAILKSNGFARDTGRRSTIVAALEPLQFSDIFEFRSLIEPYAVRRASAQLPSDAKEQISKTLDEGRMAVRQMDAQRLLQADARFHQMIYRWSGNQVIESSMQINWHHIRRGMAEVLRDPAAAAPSWDAHQRIADAMLTNEADVAEREMMLHIELARTRTMAAFEGVSSGSEFDQRGSASEN